MRTAGVAPGGAQRRAGRTLEAAHARANAAYRAALLKVGQAVTALRPTLARQEDGTVEPRGLPEPAAAPLRLAIEELRQAAAHARETSAALYGTVGAAFGRLEGNLAAYLVWRLQSKVAHLLVGGPPGVKPGATYQRSLAAMFEGESA